MARITKKKVNRREIEAVRKRAEAIRKQNERYNRSASNISSLELREIRNQVRFISGMLSTEGRVTPKMGNMWACEFKERIVIWTPISPLPPFKRLTPEVTLFLIGHEAGHLNFTGGWDWPKGWTRRKVDAFNLFVNFVEDVRIERLMGERFPGFKAIRGVDVEELFKFHSQNAKNYPIYHQVALNWYELDVSDKTVGTKECQEFARKTWPEVSKMCNADSTRELAASVLPIFELLWKEQMKEETGESGDEAQEPGAEGQGEGEGQGASGEGQGEGQPGSSSGSSGSSGSGKQDEKKEPKTGNYGKDTDLADQAEQFDGAGDEFSDQPSKEPARSELGDQQNGSYEDQLADFKEQIQELKNEVKDPRTKQALENMKNQIEAAKNQAEHARDKTEAQEPGAGRQAGSQRGRGFAPSLSYWENRRRVLDPQIKALGHRLRTTLKSNAMGGWEEGKRRGRMNTHRAKKSVSGDNRIFRKRTQVGDLDYTFGILVDCSSSMNDDIGGPYSSRSEAALDATVLFAEALEKAGLDSFIVTWESVLREVKPVNKHLNDEHRAAIGTSIHSSPGGTYEAPALIEAQEQMSRVSSGHKMVFVISDGDTANIDESKILAAELMDSGTRVVAIGLGCEPAAHHPIQVKIDKIEELPRLLPKLINEMMRKGGGTS